MKTSLKSIKKIAAGLMVAALAVGFSAFTNYSTNQQYEFVRVSGLPNSIDPMDYEFRPSGECKENPSLNCSAEWEEANPPSIGDHPTGTLDPSSIKKGTLEE